jgi:ribulose 1,5-bisphosphate synthetase/thiazole synthase
MSPGADNEGFDVQANLNGHTNGFDSDVENAVIVGGGPAGLMLGYGLPTTLVKIVERLTVT